MTKKKVNRRSKYILTLAACKQIRTETSYCDTKQTCKFTSKNGKTRISLL